MAVDERGTGSDWASLSKAWPSEHGQKLRHHLLLNWALHAPLFHKTILSHPLALSLFLCLSRSLYPFLILSVSPCILLSVMSALCVQRSGRVGDYFLIYLQAEEQLRPAQYSCACECLCVCVCALAQAPFERNASQSERLVFVHVLCACTRAFPAHV